MRKETFELLYLYSSPASEFFLNSFNGKKVERGITKWRFQLLKLKGLFTNFFLLFKSHILDSNGVWGER